MSEYDKEYYAKNRTAKRAKWDTWSKTLKGQFITSKNKAKYNNQEWSLTLEQYSDLRNKLCYYCDGLLPASARGLDRIDNSKGYTKDNVLPCCGGCNTLRSNILSVEETLQIVKLLKQLRNKENLW